MQRKFILCLFRNGDFCLLIFFSIFLNIVYGWTAQNSAINSKNFVQRIFFELLCRVYKTPKFGGMYFMNVHPLSTYPQNFAVLYTLCSLVCMDTLLRTLSSIPQYQKKKLRKLFCFVSYLRKCLSLAFLVSESHVRADKPGWQCVKHNICGWTYFEHLLGQFFLPCVKLKQNSKMCGHRHFSKYLSNNCRTPSNHHNNYAKTLHCSIILHSCFQSQSLLERFFK